jgi:uncharacterized cupredoxin-like copper-binding protein
MKRILSLLVLAAVAAVTVFAVGAHARSTQSTATTVKVTIPGFRFQLSRKSAPHGKVTFKVTNKHSIKHDFKIAGKRTPLLKKGQTRSITVTLTKGKIYTYICTVPGHAALGMKGKFKAT